MFIIVAKVSSYAVFLVHATDASTESARAAQFQWSQYPVTSLLEEIQPHAECKPLLQFDDTRCQPTSVHPASVPSEARQEILGLIRQFLDMQIEK